MPSFLVCIHDATPAHARETRAMVRDLAPLVGRELSFGVVPDWHGAWALPAHRDYCQLVQEASAEILLHGYFHRRQRGWGPASWLTRGSDEMNGLGLDETRRTLDLGQEVFADVFGDPARGFLAPGWQCGHVRSETATSLGLDYVLGFFCLESSRGGSVRLATWTWDCGRWGWLGHVGDATGSLVEAVSRGVPVLAIHPKDLERGYWPRVLDLVRRLLASGHQPSTPGRLLRELTSRMMPDVATVAPPESTLLEARRGSGEC